MVLAALASSDFERARAAAAKFRRADARTTAQLALAANILNTTAPIQGRRYERLVPLNGLSRGR
jgi:hypothetical protein